MKQLAAAGGISGWSTFYRYLLWTIVSSDTSTVVALNQQFETYDMFMDAIKAGVPSTGGNFDESVYVIGFDLVDVSDSYPNLRRCRNSMYSGIRGRKKHLVREAGSTYGVSSNFNNGAFYADAGTIDDGLTAVNWYNNLARNLLRYYLSADPGSNNDGAIWATWGKNTRWNMPKVGMTMNIGSIRGAVWDIVAGAYVATTVPPNQTYYYGDPIYLYDWKAQGVLDARNASELNQGNWYTMNSVGIMAFPVIQDAAGSPRWIAMQIFPFGADTWYTEYLDPSEYELIVRTNFRHENMTRYSIVPASQHHQTSESMFNLWNKDKSGSCQLWTPEQKWQRGNIDNDRMPTGFDVSRRSKVTGARSPYKQLFKVRRRIPYANSRIDPAFL